jgi:hypothetical protein
MDTATKKQPGLAFLNKLYEKIKELAGNAFSKEDFDNAVKFARSHAGGTAKAQKNMPNEAGEMSLTRRIEMINAALSEAFKRPFSGESWFYWAREIFDDYVIVSSTDDGKYYKVPYAVDADDVTFGEPVEVEQTFAPVSSSEVNLVDLCADGHGARLFNELQEFAAPPEWIPFLPKPGKYNSPRYGEIVITEERNQNFIANFENKVYQEKLPIDAEHETKISGALGWITEMRANDDGSVDARAEWTDRGTKLIGADRFKYGSPEWFEKWTDPLTEEEHKDVAVGYALTTRPFFKEKSLRPLVASERGLEATETDPKELLTTQTVIFTALAPVKTKEGTMPEPVATAEKTGAEKETEEARAGAQSFAEMQASLQAAEARAQAAEDEARKLSERTTALEKEARTKRFSGIIRDSEGGGAKRFLGEDAKHLEFMESLSEKFGETSDQVKFYVEQQQAHAEQVRSSNLFKEAGRTGGGGEGSAYVEMESKARAMCEKDSKLTLEQAISRVAEEEPALYRRYLNEQSE